MRHLQGIVILLVLTPCAALAGPKDAERFTRIGDVRLADDPQFEELSKRFGPSAIRVTGDAGTANAGLCYQASDRKSVVEFFRGENNVGFELRKPRDTDDACPVATALQPRSVAGISLGMSREEYLEAVGTPTTETPERLKHDFEYDHVRTDAERATLARQRRDAGFYTNVEDSLERRHVGIRLSARFDGGRLAAFRVDRSEDD